MLIRNNVLKWLALSEDEKFKLGDFQITNE